jgi:hypothetical protein
LVWKAIFKSAVKIMNDSTLSEADQIDALASGRNWWHGDEDDIGCQGVKAYMNDSLNLESTVAIITARIDLAYSSADYRQPVPPSSELPAYTDVIWKTEAMLQELWYSVLHTARQIPCRDNTAHTQLLELVRTLKTHPDPS